MVDSMKGKAAICGLGITEMGKVYGHDARYFAAKAIELAIEDAGLRRSDIDGLLLNEGMTPWPGGGALSMQNVLGLRNLRLQNHMNAFGSTTGAMVQFASLAVNAGMANYVVCVFADAPLREGRGAGAAYGGGGAMMPSGLRALPLSYGFFGANTGYAMAARRHMAEYGTTSRQFGAVSVSTRAWATMNERAQMKEPLTIDDHQNSRMIVDPLHLLDCCLVSNGGVAVIVTTAERAKALKQPPVYVWGMGQGHPGDTNHSGWKAETETGAAISGKTAFEMAGITPKEVDVCELYDCYTYTTMVTLEDYGFCKKGEGGAFVEDGKLGPGGSLPTNTGGGQLSGYYMWGMTPLSEAVIQGRGQGGTRQVKKNDVVLVSGNGGILNYHSTLVLSPNPS